MAKRDFRDLEPSELVDLCDKLTVEELELLLEDAAMTWTFSYKSNVDEVARLMRQIESSDKSRTAKLLAFEYLIALTPYNSPEVLHARELLGLEESKFFVWMRRLKVVLSQRVM